MEIVLLILYYIILISISLDVFNAGLISIYFGIKWRYLKWKNNEKSHDWGDWIKVEGGMCQIRFCKICGKLDTR